MDNSDMSDMFKNIEKIKSFSNLMNGGVSGGGTPGDSNPMDMMKAIETARKLSGFMNIMNKQKEEEPIAQESANIHQRSESHENYEPNENYEPQSTSVISSGNDPFSPGREINVLNAAIPFLDKEYQKSLYIAIKLLEMNKISRMDTISIQSFDTPNKPKELRKNDMLLAIRPYLSFNEQKDIDVIIKAIEMKNIMKSVKY